MKILIDTNVLVSCALFPNARMNHFLYVITVQHNLIVSSYSIQEIHCAIPRKFPQKMSMMESFLQRLRHTIVDVPKKNVLGTIVMRDPKDYPILATAVAKNVDVLITGDRDFDDVELERPEILNIAAFMNKYG